MQVHIHLHDHRQSEEKLDLIIKNQKIIMGQNEKVLEFANRLDAATNEIASDLQALRDEVADKVSEETLAKVDATITRLEAMGQDPENPVPPVEPTPPGE